MLIWLNIECRLWRMICAMQQIILMASSDVNEAVHSARLLEGAIANLPIFNDMPQHQIAEIASLSRRQIFKRGVVIFRRGERLPGVIAIAYGLVKLTVGSLAREERTVCFVGANETFGEEAALLDRPSPVNAVTLADSMIVVIPQRCMVNMFNRNPAFVRNLTGAFADRFLGQMAELEASHQQSSVLRLAHYLNSLAEPGDVSGSWTVRLPVSKTALAARFGITKETMSRLLRDLADRGLIAVARHNISILDRTGLVKMAD